MMRVIIGLIGCLGMLVSVGCGGAVEAKAPPPPAVEVAMPVVRDVTSYYHYTGNLEAVAQVQIRARVPGYLQEMHFDPSTAVEAGTKLFTIEKEPYEIGVQSAEAGVQSAQAAVELATIERNQIQEAFDKGAANERERQKYITTLKTREADLLSAEAQLRQAKLELSYTDVTTPIAGRVSRELIDIGDLVGVGEPTLLTTVVQMDPVYVYFDVSERIVQEYLNRGKDGSVGDEEGEDRPTIEIGRSSDEQGEFPFSGVIDYADSVVDRSTGTLRVRGRIDNPEAKLYPGLFVRARAPYDQVKDAVLVREDALGTDLTGKYVLVVGEKNIVERRAIELGDTTDDGYIVVTEGIGPDERYVTLGIQKARPGAPVTIRESKKAKAEQPKPKAEPAATTDQAGGE